MSEHVLVTDDAGFPALINGDKPVIVDFWAEWCPPCRAIAPVLDKMAGENPQVITAKINVDQSQASAAKYGVRSIPTIILFHKGAEVDRIVGASQPMLAQLFAKGKSL